MARTQEYDEDSHYRIIYTQPGAEVFVDAARPETAYVPRSEVRRQSTIAYRPSRPSADAEKTNRPTGALVRVADERKANFSKAVVPITRESATVMTDTLATKAHHTSSKTGVLYFAFASDLSPELFRANCKLESQSSNRPIALGKLKGWQWFVSSRGIPNIVPLCEAGVYNDNGTLRRRSSGNDANVVYGLIYNIHYNDEYRVDERHGYLEHGPFNDSFDLDEVEQRPCLQGDNKANKQYQRTEIVRWLRDPLLENLDVNRDASSVKCLVYVDETSRGLRPGRIWDDEISQISDGATIAVREYGLSRGWVENVMGQHGITILKARRRKSKSRDRKAHEKSKSMSKNEGVRVRTREIENEEDTSESDDDSIVETRRIKVVERNGPSRSGFYREKKKGRATRYISL